MPEGKIEKFATLDAFLKGRNKVSDTLKKKYKLQDSNLKTLKATMAKTDLFKKKYGDLVMGDGKVSAANKIIRETEVEVKQLAKATQTAKNDEKLLIDALKRVKAESPEEAAEKTPSKDTRVALLQKQLFSLKRSQNEFIKAGKRLMQAKAAKAAAEDKIAKKLQIELILKNSVVDLKIGGTSQMTIQLD